jgi:hypothetical protein
MTPEWHAQPPSTKHAHGCLRRQQHLALEGLEQGACLVTPPLKDELEVRLLRRTHVQQLVSELPGREDQEEVGSVVALDSDVIAPNCTEVTQKLDHMSGGHRRPCNTDHSHQCIGQSDLYLANLWHTRDNSRLKKMPTLRAGGPPTRQRCRR